VVRKKQDSVTVDYTFKNKSRFFFYHFLVVTV